MYRAAKKDITRKSLRYKGFRRFLMHFSLLLRDLNKTTGILLSAKKDITLFSRQFARLVHPKTPYYGGSRMGTRAVLFLIAAFQNVKHRLAKHFFLLR